MSVQILRGEGLMSKLCLTWEILALSRGLLVAIATDTEFTKNLRSFLIPPMATCVQLDSGNGEWFIRIGCLTGDAQKGIVEWGQVYGPVAVASVKGFPKEPECALPVIHTQSIKDGLRFHTGYMLPMYCVMESSVDMAFPATKTKWTYMYDWGRGYQDCMGLEFQYTYSVRIRTWSPDGTKMPEEDVRTLSKPVTVHGKKPARHVRMIGSGDLSTSRVEDVLLREARERPNMRFASHADYLKFVAAKAKQGEERKPERRL